MGEIQNRFTTAFGMEAEQHFAELQTTAFDLFPLPAIP